MVRHPAHSPSAFNHYRDPTTHACVPYANTARLPADVDAQCARDAPDYDGYWYEATNVRKVPLSRCRGGARPDRGAQHRCPHTPIRHGAGWWIGIVLLAGVLGTACAYWYTRGGDVPTLGALRLDENAAYRDAREQLGLLRHFVLGLASLAWTRILEATEWIPAVRSWRSQRAERPFSSYHMLSTDEDAEMLHDYDSDELPPP